MKWLGITVAALLAAGAACAQEKPESLPEVEIQAAREMAVRAQKEAKAATDAALARVQYLQKRLPGEAFVNLFGGAADVKVDLSLDDAKPKDALKALFSAAKLEYATDGELPEEPRLTLKARGVPFGTALDLITQTAGLRWGREIKDGKSLYHVGKTLKMGGMGNSFLWTAPKANGLGGLRNFPMVLDGAKLNGTGVPAPMVYSFSTAERVSSFTCPHCHGTVTMVRKAEAPACPKCGRRFQADWQFCPVDGTKRPATASDSVKYCPLCGKPVEVDKEKDRK